MIGTKLYTFSLNRRVYRKDPKKGYGSGGPIYSEHFQEYVIDGEDEKDWHSGYFRINKRSGKGYYSAQPREKYTMYTEAEREADIWIHENSYKLREAVGRCKDITILKRIAEMVGYKATM
jgi:hypothetical protein